MNGFFINNEYCKRNLSGKYRQADWKVIPYFKILIIYFWTMILQEINMRKK